MTRSLCTLLVFVYLLVGCASNEPGEQPPSPLPMGTPIPFVLLHQDFENSNDQYYRTPSVDFGPRVTLIESAEDAQAIAYRLPPAAEEVLAHIDYTRTVALILFMGIQGSPGFGVETKGIYQSAQALNIYADFWEPDCSGGCPTESTSPFQIIGFSRSDLGNAQLHLSPNLIATIHKPTPIPPR